MPPSTSTLRAHVESSLGEHLSSTLLLREKAAPVTVSTGVASLDDLTGGFPRGALSEITGPASSGRTGVMFSALAGATHRDEACALVDANDSFDPASATAAGVDLDRLLWVRCSEADRSVPHNNQRRSSLGRLEQVLKVTDLLLQSGGFGMVVLDLGDIPPESARRIPLTSWFRFRRAVEPTSTVLLVVEQEPCAKNCASLVVRLQKKALYTRDANRPVEKEFHGEKFFRIALELQDPVGAPGFSPVNRFFPKALGFSPGTSPLPNAGLLPHRNRSSCAEPAIPTNVVAHASLLQGVQLHAEVLRSWKQRKPMHSVGTNFELRAAW